MSCERKCHKRVYGSWDLLIKFNFLPHSCYAHLLKDLPAVIDIGSDSGLLR